MKKLKILNQQGEVIHETTPGKMWSPVETIYDEKFGLAAIMDTLTGDLDDYKHFVARMIYDSLDGHCRFCGSDVGERGHDEDCELIQFQNKHQK